MVEVRNKAYHSSGSISMGLMGSTEPIIFDWWLLNPSIHKEEERGHFRNLEIFWFVQ